MRTNRARRALRLLAGVALLTGFGLAAHTAHAQTYTTVYMTVNTHADDPTATCGTPGSPPTTPPHISGPCSLRGVSEFANAASSAAHYYVIYAAVPAGTYLIDPAQGPITFTNAYSKTHLNGASLYTTFVDGQNATQMFYNNGSNLTIQQMTLQHGNGTNAGTAGNGGALASSGGALALTDTVVQNNTATGYDGGGLALSDSVDNLTRVIVRNNEAQYGGGIYINSSAADLYNNTVTNNLACVTFTAPSTCSGDGQGGGMYADSDITVQGGSFSTNRAGSTALSDLSGEGGGIYNAFEMYLVTVRVNSNVAGNDGGGYYGASGEYESLHNSSFSYNQAGYQGGGIWVSGLDFVTGSVINNNIAGVAPTGGASPTTGNTGDGGGMYIADNGNEQQFSGDTFQSNQALTDSTVTAGTCGSEGGGLYSSSYVSMGSSHFLYNIACDGGGIYDDSSTSKGYLSLNNSSLTNNTARVQGGGLYSNYTGQPAHIGIDATGITANTAADAGGFYDGDDPAGYLLSSGAVILGNSATGGAGTCRNIGDLPCT